MTEQMLVAEPKVPRSPTLAARREQMFPRLESEEIERLRRFGDPQTYDVRQFLARVGDPGAGLIVLVEGTVEITRRLAGDRSLPIATLEVGGFLGELAQRSGRPWLIDALATSNVSALLISPRSLRALLIAEADLGQKIMRALILRRWA